MRQTKYSLTEAHRAKLRPWADKWIANALRTDPMTDSDRDALRSAMDGLYRAAKLTPPSIGVFCASPITGAIAASIASGAWWIRENPEKHQALFGCHVSEAQLMASVRLACAHAVVVGMHAVHRDDGPPPTLVTIQPTRAATSAATSDATSDATYAATRDATDAATYAATSAATREPLPTVARFLVGCLQHWHRFRDGGNQWSGWSSYLSFFWHVAKLDLPEYDKYQHYEDAAVHGGPRFMHARFWIVSDFPTFVSKDVRHRPHSTDGPFLAWNDGWRLYADHGVTMPAWVYEQTDRLTVERIESERNAEVRRVMIGRYGTERYMRDSGASLVNEDRDELDLPRRLFERVHADGARTLAVHVHNSTVEPDGRRREFWLRVHPELRPLPTQINGWQLGEPQALTARNAVASTFGLTGEQYAPVQQT